MTIRFIRKIEGFLRDLSFGHFFEKAAALYKFFIISAFYDAAGLYHENTVGFYYRAEPVGDNYSRGMEIFEALRHDGLRFVVQRARGFVENNDPRFFNERPRY